MGSSGGRPVSKRPTLLLEDAQSTLRAVMARGVATAVIGGIDQCAEIDRPLNQLQQIELVTMACMAYHDAVDEGMRSLEVGSKILNVAEGHHRNG